MPGDAADPRRNFLDRRHQRKGQQHGPADAVAELRAGLAVGADPRRIIVGGAGDQSGAEPFADVADAKRLLGSALVAGLLAGMRRVVFCVRFVAICHARSSRRQRTGSRSVPGDLAGTRSALAMHAE